MVRSQTLSSIYQLVSLLCVFEIVSGAWTIASFGFGETGESQLMLMFYAAFSVVALYPLTTSVHRTDHRLSRVDKHVQALSVLLMGWFLILLTATIFLFTRGHDRVLPLCFTDTFQVLSVRCTSIVIDLTLPVAIIAILFSAVCRIALRARAIHGDEMVPLPPPPPPPPPPVQLVPAWALGNVAETEESGRYRILLDNP
ncbi:hypothetical protein B0H13DRAFT_1947123 [Mycena leptocephala]|nr:hypothetical protein B0H13DRAFT_1947123 [Mycena leptocephala]